jgi:hypothetical protein
MLKRIDGGSNYTESLVKKEQPSYSEGRWASVTYTGVDIYKVSPRLVEVNFVKPVCPY